MSRTRTIRPTGPGRYWRLPDGSLSDVPPAPPEPKAPPVALLEPAAEPDHKPESLEDEP
jgi:hypothetical protein